MFPMDPTPYVIVYGVIVFLYPWIMFVSSLTQQMWYLNKKTPLEWPFINTPSVMRAARQYRESDPVAMGLHKRVSKWGLLTIVSWIVGFALLFLTLYSMESNNLLINHSKGIYR